MSSAPDIPSSKSGDYRAPVKDVNGSYERLQDSLTVDDSTLLGEISDTVAGTSELVQADFETNGPKVPDIGDIYKNGKACDAFEDTPYQSTCVAAAPRPDFKEHVSTDITLQGLSAAISMLEQLGYTGLAVTAGFLCALSVVCGGIEAASSAEGAAFAPWIYAAMAARGAAASGGLRAAEGVANGSARLAESGVVNPSTIRFSQNSISARFKNGSSVKDLAAGLRNGSVDPRNIPAIRLVERDGTYYTLDNRRLAAFQEADIDVPYRLATPQEVAREGWKFTTTNNGTSIHIRGSR